MFVGMALDTCTVHAGERATRRCGACNKPLCKECPNVEGCCSERCAAANKRFATSRVPPKPKRSPWQGAATLAVLAVAAYFAAKHLGLLG